VLGEGQVTARRLELLAVVVLTVINLGTVFGTENNMVRPEIRHEE
jgi:hypothetical protein